MFVSPEVKGKVTLRLGKPTPFLEALEAVLTQNYCQYEIEDNIITVSKTPLFARSFSLEYALASSVAPLLTNYLGPEDSVEINDQKNEITLSSDLYTLDKIRELLDSLDVADKQLSEKSFTVKYYLEPEELVSLVKENLSPLGEIRLDRSKEVLIVKDTSYSIFEIARIIRESDDSILFKKTYKIKYAPLSLLRQPVEDLLSDEGRLEVKEEISRFTTIDVRKNMEKIDNLLGEMDILANRLVEKRYLLEYLTPEEARDYLQFKNVISEYGEIRVPVVREEVEVGSVKNKSEYVIIPQETVENIEGVKAESTQLDLPEGEENVIYVTDLKGNIEKIDEAIEEMNSPSRAEEIINRTFYIGEGSLERIALAMANILGINPGDIEGLEPKGEWMQIEVPSAEINLGTLGPR